MSDAIAQGRELEAYSRVINASPGRWIAALRYFGQCPELELSVSHPGRTVGSLASLEVGSQRICHMTSRVPFCLCGRKSAGRTLMMVRSGELLLEQEGAHRELGPGTLVLLGSREKIAVRASSETSVILIQLPASETLEAAGTGPVAAARKMVPLVEHYLAASRYFRNHSQAVSETRALTDRLLLCLRDPSVECLPASAAPDDERALKALAWMRSQPHWKFNLQELAGVAGASRRNLYYLMKAETGMTPYRFYQRCRLLRFRDAFITCNCPDQKISWHASSEGFSHLGRFASLYREHFGELPSETLGWLNQLNPEPVTCPLEACLTAD